MDEVTSWDVDAGERDHRARHALAGAGLLAAVALLKIAAGPDFSFSAVALLPVAYVAWYVSRRAALVMAVCSAATLLFANVFLLGRYPSAIVDFWNASMDLAVFVVLGWSVSETRAQYRRAARLARRDPLTGLFNRRAFLDALRFESRRARRYRTAITLAYIDVDDFKIINDTSGHAAGDRCLKAIAAMLTSAVRNVDVVSRLGGDEFGVLLTDVAAERPDAVLADIAGALHRIDSSVCPRASLSIGAITFTTPGDDPQAMIRAADELLYDAKRSGKNRLVHEHR